LNFKQNKLLLCFLALNISACSSVSTPPSSQSKPNYIPPIPSAPNTQTANIKGHYTCQNPNRYAGKVVGDGECVSFIKTCSIAPNTKLWSEGKKVMSLPFGSIPKGTIIATFKNGKYPNVTGYHAAIYISHDKQGIWVWDQWAGKAVHKRLIRFRHDNAPASNTAQAYSIVK